MDGATEVVQRIRLQRKFEQFDSFALKLNFQEYILSGVYYKNIRGMNLFRKISLFNLEDGSCMYIALYATNIKIQYVYGSHFGDRLGTKKP